VTDRDLALKVVADGRDVKSTKVADVMTHKVVTCHVDDDLQKAVDAMAEHQLRRMPVVDNENLIVGSFPRQMWQRAPTSRRDCQDGQGYFAANRITVASGLSVKLK